MVFDHQAEYGSQWAAMESIAAKVGCTAETLRKWVRQSEQDQGIREGLSGDEHERLKALERENRELKRANEILRQASALSDILKNRYFPSARLQLITLVRQAKLGASCRVQVPAGRAIRKIARKG